MPTCHSCPMTQALRSIPSVVRFSPKVPAPKSTAEYICPPRVVLCCIGVHGLVRTSVHTPIGLIVSVEIDPLDEHPTADRLLPNAAGHRPPRPVDGARQTNIDRNDPGRHDELSQLLPCLMAAKIPPVPVPRGRRPCPFRGLSRCAAPSLARSKGPPVSGYPGGHGTSGCTAHRKNPYSDGSCVGVEPETSLFCRVRSISPVSFVTPFLCADTPEHAGVGLTVSTWGVRVRESGRAPGDRQMNWRNDA